MPRKLLASAAAVGVIAAAVIAVGLQGAPALGGETATTTPIKHVVVIFGENISFDHYFGTYPNAANTDGPTFSPAVGTPSIDGLTPALLTANPNGVNPTRIPSTPAAGTVTCDNNHGYSAEQKAFHGGMMDKFPPSTGCGAGGATTMSYFDGNTVTAMWNYAQHFAMSDRSFGTGFGPSTLGALELVSGDLTGPVDLAGNPIAANGGNIDNNTVFANGDPFASYDGCSSAGAYAMSAATSGAAQHKNVGDLLNAKGLTWGWFQGGFTPTGRAAPDATYPVAGKPTCATAHLNKAGANGQDYDAHHNPFAYYESTANPEHLAPTGTIGTTDQANHQYDVSNFNDAVTAGALPAVSFVKAGHYQDGHAGYSDPLDEQDFIVDEVNRITASSQWGSTAIILAYDDSDGWYDHVSSPIVRTSATSEDFYSSDGHCDTNAQAGAVAAPDRCGFGPRLPLVVISPYAKTNFVDHSVTDQTSILRFVEDNWCLGRIGRNSLDAAAGPLTGMFDFATSTVSSPAVQLNANGTVNSTTPSPVRADNTSTCTPPVETATATPIASPTPTPTDTTPKLGKLTCKGKARRKRVTVTCTVAKKPALKTDLRFRLKRAGKQLATRAARLSGTSVKVKLKLAKKARHGSYKLLIAITQPGRSGTRPLTLKL